jgi:hypothetical protein
MPRGRKIISISVVAVVLAGACALAWWIHRDTSSAAGGIPGNVAAAAPIDRSLTIPEAEREFLWSLEHHGNLLNKYGLKRLGAALAAEDRDALFAMFAPEFEARLFSQARRAKLEGASFEVERQERQGDGAQTLAAAEFVDWLLELRKPFSPPPKLEFGISSLSPAARDELDGDWQGTCKMRLWGSAGPDHPAETVVVLKFRTVRPEKERLEEPGWFLGCSVEQVARGNSQGYLFRETAEERGLEPARFYDNWKEAEKFSHTGGIYACDYNRDGCVDLLITDRNFPWVALYQGLPSGAFQDVTREVGLVNSSGQPPWGFTGQADVCVIADLDNDGWEDLIALGGAIFRNVDGKRFEPANEGSNLFRLIYGDPPERTGPTTILPADFDRDGLVDLYVVRSGLLRDSEAGWIDEEPLRNAGNQLLRNLGKGRFQDVTVRSGTAGGNRSVFTAAWLDVNNDDWPDVYVINELGKGVLLVNQGNGTFQERELVEGPADFGSMGVAAGDIDNDGYIDLYSANMYSKAGNRVIGNLPEGLYSSEVMAKLKRLVQGSRMYRNTGDFKFSEVGRAFQVHDVGWAWGTALADLNNDGWLDIYATAGFMSRDRTKPDG